jgi:hypothetical protein
VRGDIENVARHITASIGRSAEWAATVNAAEENGVGYCKGHHGKPFLVPCMALELKVVLNREP